MTDVRAITDPLPCAASIAANSHCAFGQPEKRIDLPVGSQPAAALPADLRYAATTTGKRSKANRMFEFGMSPPAKSLAASQRTE